MTLARVCVWWKGAQHHHHSITDTTSNNSNTDTIEARALALFLPPSGEYVTVGDVIIK